MRLCSAQSKCRIHDLLCVCVCVCVCVLGEGGEKAGGWAVRDINSVLSSLLAVKVPLPQHESPSMCYHSWEADCLPEMGEGRRERGAGALSVNHVPVYTCYVHMFRSFAYFCFHKHCDSRQLHGLHFRHIQICQANPVKARCTLRFFL